MAFPTIPTVAAGRVLSAVEADATGTRTFPSLTGLTKASGDLLIAIIVCYQSASPAAADAAFSGWGGGFTEFLDQGTTPASTMRIGAAYKWSTGSETGTFDVTQAATITGHAAMFLLAIPGAHDSTPPEGGTIANGTGAAADPGDFDPAGWGAEDTLWIAVAGSGETNTGGSYTGIASAPSFFGNYADSGISADAVGGVEAAVAFRQENVASQDLFPFSVDTSNARNSALVIAVRPVASAGETVPPGGATAGGAAPAPSVTAAAGGATAAGASPAPGASVLIGGGAAGGTEATAQVSVVPGGALAGGTAPTESGGGTSETPTPGGAIAGGVAPTANSSLAAGGASAGGTAPTSSASVSAGGALAGGSAPAPTTSTTAGGALAGGSGPTVRVTFSPGGAIAGGVAPTDGAAVEETPTPGGAIAGGLGPTASTSMTAGGALAGGTSPTASTSAVPTPGGAIAGGTGPTASAAAPTGGAAAGGTGPAARVSMTAGGAIAGGRAPSETGVVFVGEVVLTATWPAAVSLELGLAAGASVAAASPASATLDASEA